MPSIYTPLDLTAPPVGSTGYGTNTPTITNPLLSDTMIYKGSTDSPVFQQFLNVNGYASAKDYFNRINGGVTAPPVTVGKPTSTSTQSFNQSTFTPNEVKVGASPVAPLLQNLITSLQGVGGQNNVSYNTAANRIRERSTADTSAALNSITNRNLSRGFGNSGINDNQQIQAATAVDQNTASELSNLEKTMTEFSLQQQANNVNALAQAVSAALGLGSENFQRDSFNAQGVAQNNSLLAQLFGLQEGNRLDQYKFDANLAENARLESEKNLLQKLIAFNQTDTQKMIASGQNQSNIQQQFFDTILKGIF